MKNFKRLVVLFLMVLWAQELTAHAVVMDYSLKMKPIQLNQVQAGTITFNSRIEQGLSQIFLVSKGDKQVLLPLAHGQRQGEIRFTVPALAAGDYALRLKVFAADGHLTEDIIHFSVGAIKPQAMPPEAIKSKP